ncbi:MAG: GntR family transcriptional regulator [Anaerolineae bacterium]
MAATGRKDEVYLDLRKRIMAGELLPGTQMSPPELAQRYSVSRTPVRDALNTLAQEGLVEVVPRRGYFVSRITVRDVEEIFEMRLILETASAELATARISDALIERLAHLSSRYVAGNIESYKAYLDENRQFHLAVAQAAGNRLLVEALARIFDQMQRFLILRLDLSDDADDMLAEHYLLLEAFRQRDAQRAKEAMRVAIEHARDAVLESIFRHGKDWAI